MSDNREFIAVALAVYIAVPVLTFLALFINFVLLA